MEFGPEPGQPVGRGLGHRPARVADGLTVAVYPDRTVVRDFDVLTGEQINEVEVANPLYRD